MDLRPLLTGLIAWGLYPVWLAAGGLDYLCHRRTDIEHTSGVTESKLHVAQLACMALIVALGVLAQVTLAVWSVLIVAALAHSALAYVDVSYTQSRRAITPLEQLAHSYLEVLPLVAVALLAVIHWPLETGIWFAARPGIGWGEGLLLGSFAVFAGVPVFEELLRTSRKREVRGAPVDPSALRLRHDGGRAS
jgi:hypothetical protein